MNVDLIYRLHRDEAFATLFTAKEYSTFVAMPFADSVGYAASRIYGLLQEVNVKANSEAKSKGLPKSFAALHRISAHTGSAIVITEAIALEILNQHFFVGDLTGNNPGVVLETGVALGLKANKRLVLITQDDRTEIHFDLKVTHVTCYTEDSLIEIVASALVGAAEAFEKEATEYIRFVSTGLTPDAILVLNCYGQLWKTRSSGDRPSIFEPQSCQPFHTPDGSLRFQHSIRELLTKRLMWTDYRTQKTWSGCVRTPCNRTWLEGSRTHLAT